MQDYVRNFYVKKMSAYLLAIFCLTITIGATLHQHYCMGELVGTSLFDLSDSDCGKCGMKKHTEASKECCKDVSIVIKTGDSHTFFQTAYDFTLTAFIITPVYFISTNLNFAREETEKLYRVA